MNKFMQAIVDRGQETLEIEGRVFKDPATGKFIPWELKKLTTKEVRRIRTKFTKMKKGQKIVDEDGIANAMLLASLVEPNFKDKDWLDQEGLVDPQDLMQKYLSDFGDYQYVLNKMLDLSGFTEEGEEEGITEEELDEAKN